MNSKARSLEINKARRKYLSLHSEHLKTCFLDFIKIFRNSFVVNDDSFNEKDDFAFYEVSKTELEQNLKVTTKDYSVLFYLKMSKKTFYCVE